MSRLFNKLFGSTVDAPVLVTILIVTLTALSVAGRVDSRWWQRWLPPTAAEQTQDLPELKGNSTLSQVRDQSPPERGIPQVQAVSLTNADVMLVVRGTDFFSARGAASLRAIVSRLEQLPYVREVFWLDEVPVLNVFGIRESLFPNEKASQRQFETARDNAVQHPLVGGQLLSADGQTLLLLIKLDWLFVTSDADCTTGIREAAVAAAADFPEQQLSFLLTGRVPMYLTFITSQLSNRWTYQFIGYGMTALMALILFRGIRAVLIVASAACLGVFWTIGLLKYFELQDNPFIDIVLPVLLSLIGLADGVHLLVEIRKQRGSGLAPRDAARTGVVHVGLACLLTSLTTAIGFGSLAFAHHDIVRDFGWACVFGVFVMFLSVITVIPLACSTPLGRNLHVGHERSLIERNLVVLTGMIRHVVQRARLISGIAIISTVTLILVSLTLRPDERRSNALPQDSEASRAIAHLDQAMKGMEHSEVQIRWSPNIPEESPEILEILIEVDDLLNTEPLIGHPISLRNFVDVLPGEGTPADRMPLVELLPAELKRAFYEPEKRLAKVDFRVQDLGIAKYGPVFTRIETGLHEIQTRHPEFQLELRGSAVSRWRDLYRIVVDLTLSLGSASLVIFLVLTLAYRSVRIGLISLIPNFFPLAVTGTYLVLTGQSLELASVCAFTVCLGIAVDDTIHFLTRFQEHRAHEDVGEAIVTAFTSTGTALIMTSLILVIGFMTVAFSDLRDQRIFAIMGSLTISSALFADLVFLPALLNTFLPPGSSAQQIAATEPVDAAVDLTKE